MKKNILITGASGFIGSFLVEEALNRDYETYAGIRRSSSRKYLTDPRIHFIELDLDDEESLQASLRKFSSENKKFDFIIHAAGITKALRNKDFIQSNFENTKRFIKALQDNDLVPEKFVYISSLSSFGPGNNGDPVHSLQRQEPLTAYGKSKLNVEKFLSTVPGFPFLIINPTAVYGPRDKDFIFLLKSIKNHLEIYIGSNDQLLSFIHVQDLVNAIFLSMESEAVNKKLLVSDLNDYTAKKFNSIVKNILHKKTITVSVPAPVAGIYAWFSEVSGRMKGKAPLLSRERLKDLGAKNWSMNCDEIRRLGYVPQYDLETGLKHTISWYLEEGWIKEKRLTQTEEKNSG